MTQVSAYLNKEPKILLISIYSFTKLVILPFWDYLLSEKLLKQVGTKPSFSQWNGFSI